MTAVTGTVDLERPAPAAPDAGTTAGHRAPRDRDDASAPRFAFTGRVEPASSQVTLRRGRRRARGGRRRRATARFRARARKLERGANRFVLEGRAAGLAPWKVDIAITRK